MGACAGHCGYMTTCNWAITGLESQAVLARVTKLIVTIFSKACNNRCNNAIGHNYFIWIKC